MKILHIIRTVDPQIGGPIEGVKQLAAAFRHAGNTVEVACLDAPDAPYISTFPLPVHALGPGMLRYGFGRHLIPWLRSNAGNYDVAIVNGIWGYHGFSAWRALRHGPIPYVVYTHGMLDPWFKRTYPLKHMKKWLYWPWAEYRVLRDAGAVLFTCEEERIRARQSFFLYKCNEVVVNYGTAGPLAHGAEAQRAAFLDRFPQLRGKRSILFMGRIHPKKGCDLALQAFAQVLGGDPDCCLVMAGPDQVGWQPELAAMADKLGISSQVVWTGMISGDVKWGALHTAEVFLFPSHQENFGIVVAEALACNVPALISTEVNIWQEIQQDGAGLVAEDTAEGAASLLRQWMELSDSAMSAMRRNARACFERRFEIGSAAESLLRVLTRLTGSQSGERAGAGKVSAAAD